MNIFYPKTTRGLKVIPDFTDSGENENVFFTQHGVYSIDSEGTLYVSKRYMDGSFDVDDWEEVILSELKDNNEFDAACLAESCLMEQAQKEGWYFRFTTFDDVA